MRLADMDGLLRIPSPFLAPTFGAEKVRLQSACSSERPVTLSPGIKVMGAARHCRWHGWIVSGPEKIDQNVNGLLADTVYGLRRYAV